MTIKHKLLGNALFTSMLMLGILGTLAWSFGSLQKGLGQIVENSRVGSEMSQKTETTLDRASSDLAAASADLAEVAKEIAVTNQAIRINQRKIADISGTLADFSESINGVVDDLPDGDTRWELEDLSFKLAYNAGEYGKLMGVYHIFSAVDDFDKPNGSSTDDLGSEFDVAYNYKITKDLGLLLKGAWYSKGDEGAKRADAATVTLKDVANHDVTKYWVQLDYKFHTGF